MKNLSSWMIILGMVTIGLLAIHDIYIPHRMSEGGAESMLIIGVLLAFLLPFVNYFEDKEMKTKKYQQESTKKDFLSYFCSSFYFVGILYFLGYLFGFFNNVWTFIIVILIIGTCEENIRKLFNFFDRKK